MQLGRKLDEGFAVDAEDVFPERPERAADVEQVEQVEQPVRV